MLVCGTIGCCAVLSQASVLVEKSVGVPVVTGAMPQGRSPGKPFLT